MGLGTGGVHLGKGGGESMGLGSVAEDQSFLVNPCTPLARGSGSFISPKKIFGFFFLEIRCSFF